VVRAERKKGAGGPGFNAAWRGKMGEKEWGSGTAGDSSGRRHWPPAGGRGRRRCRATGEGNGARAMRARAANRQDRTTLGPGGSDGVWERVREWGNGGVGH
jgi:hypothetical protein